MPRFTPVFESGYLVNGILYKHYEDADKAVTETYILSILNKCCEDGSFSLTEFKKLCKEDVEVPAFFRDFLYNIVDEPSAVESPSDFQF